jgi:hypothetical protein
MKIADLSYLENTSENELILGGDGSVLGITAQAAGTTTKTDTDVTMRNAGKVTIAKGTGEALAIDKNPYADVDVYYAGFDIMNIKTKSKKGDEYAYEKVKVIAVDTPRK